MQPFVFVIVSVLFGCGKNGDGDAARQASEQRNKAVTAVDKQDWATAIAACTEAIRLEPKNVDGWWLRGLAHLKNKDHEKAVEDCSEALKLDAKFDAAYRERGLAYLNLKKHKEAVDDFTSFIGFRPDDPEGYQFRALGYIRSGNDTAAKADLDKADKLKAKKK